MEQIQNFLYSRQTNGNASITHESLVKTYLRLKDLDPPQLTSGDVNLVDNKNVGMAYVLMIEPFITLFSNAADEFKALVRQQVGSVHSREMEVFDFDRDRLLNMADRAIANGIRSSNPEIVKAANEVDVIRRAYGDIVHFQRIEQTEMIENLIRDLTTEEMKPYLEKIPGLRSTLEAIGDVNDQFLESLENRRTESQEIIHGGTLEARKKSDAAAIDVATAVNMLAKLYTDPLLTDVIKEINVILTEASHVLSAHQRGLEMSKDNETENPDEIEEIFYGE